MKRFGQNLPVLLLVSVELAAGILLFLKPAEFMQAVIILFGILLLALGAYDLFRFLRDRKNLGVNHYFTLTFAILALALGAFSAFGSKLVIGLFGVLAAVCGVLLLVAGVCKAKWYFELRAAGAPVSLLLLISAIFAVLVGGLVALHPFDSIDVLWRFTGIALIVEAIGDAAAAILSLRA